MAQQSKINPRYYFTERLRQFLSRPLGIFLDNKKIESQWQVNQSQKSSRKN
jgi:hypothetical protein